MMTDARLIDLDRIQLSSYAETIIVTGGYGGIGAECVRALHNTHPNALIVVAGRNEQKAKTFARALSPNVAGARVNLSSLADVDVFAKSIVARANQDLPPIKALICNAGTQAGMGKMNVSEDGLEETFAVNHLAHMHLTMTTLPAYQDHSRLIVVSSGTHDPKSMEGRFNKPVLLASEDLADPQNRQTAKTNSLVRYSTSKLCNLLFAYEFARRAEELAPNKSIDVLAYDPGGVPDSDLMRGTNPLAKRVMTAPWLIKLLGVTTRTPDEAGRHLAALLHNAVEDNPSYWRGPDQRRSFEASYDVETAQRLWDQSSALIDRVLRSS